MNSNTKFFVGCGKTTKDYIDGIQVYIFELSQCPDKTSTEMKNDWLKLNLGNTKVMLVGRKNTSKNLLLSLWQQLGIKDT